ncbi:MAG: thioredoxin family protein [Bacteroidota bacterium]
MKQLCYIAIFTFILQGSAQPKYEEIQSSNGSTFLLGEITTANLESAPYQAWFSTNFDGYGVDTHLVRLFENTLRQHKILLFLGTWCGDSKREVPRILKILEEANFPREQLRIIALDPRKAHYKKGLHGEEKGWDIKRVPTLILLKDGKEVNRIVERPVDTLEEDLLAILNNTPYTPNYAD